MKTSIKTSLFYLVVIVLLSATQLQAQSNTFPSSGNVGIGTTSPSKKLHVHNGTAYITPVPYAANQSAYALKIGAYNNSGFDMGLQIKSTSGGVPYMSFKTTGADDVLTLKNSNVGIGTTSPSSNLHIKNSNTGAAHLIIQRKGYVGGKGGEAGAEFGSLVFKNDHFNDYGAMIQAGISQIGWADHSALDFLVSSGNAYEHVMRINSNKNVGIGTTNPSHKLSVAGTINSEEIIVEENVGADFVFEASYDLPTLQDIEAFIEQNQHLPGIAPASQMIEEGVKVGELQMQLLQKIEELTLYTIEQQKLIEATLEQNQSLVQKSHQLEQRIKHLEQHEN
jgi:hypothetical protein